MENPFVAIEKRLSGIENLLSQIYAKSIEEEEIYFNVKEAAKFLNVSEQSIHNYIREGKIPAKKVGRPYLILKSDLLTELGEVKSLKYQRS
jgi:excisionase family DNA binding protein